MPDRQQHSVIPPAIAKALSDKLYDKQRSATLKIEKLVRDALDADDDQRINEIVAELTTDFATSERESSRIGGLVALAATAVALTHVNIRPFLPLMIPPMVSAMSDGESKVRYFACESLYNVAKVGQGHILRWFNDIFDGLARVTADSVRSVKDGADYLDRLVKDIVAEQAATCLDWYGAPPATAENALQSGMGAVSLLEGSGLKISGIVDVHPAHPAPGLQPAAAASTPMSGASPGEPSVQTSGAMSPSHQQQGHYTAHSIAVPAPKAPRLAFSLENFVPLLAERMHTYKPSTRLYLIEWVRVLDSVPGLDLIAYLPEFLDGLIRFLSDPNDDVRTKTQSLLGELLSEVRECMDLQRFSDAGELANAHEGGLFAADEQEYYDDAGLSWGEAGSGELSSARVRSSTIQSDVHVEGRFASESNRLAGRLSQRPSRAPSISSSIPNRNHLNAYSHNYYHASGRQQLYLGSAGDNMHFRHQPLEGSSSGSGIGLFMGGGSGWQSRNGGTAIGRSALHRQQGMVGSSAVSLVSSALANGQLNEMTDELRMAARRKKIRAERADNALIPGANVVIDFARCISILIPHLESNDQEIQGIALCWVYEFTWLCPQVMVQYVPKLVNAILPSVSHPVANLRHTAEDANLRLYDLVGEAPAPVTEQRKKHPAAAAAETAAQDQQKKAPGGQMHLKPADAIEHGARPAKPLLPVTSTAVAAVSNHLPRPQSPSFSTHSIASGAPVITRSRAESLLQASTVSPAASVVPSRVTTPAPQGGGEKQAGAKTQHAQSLSPPIGAASSGAQQQVSGDSSGRERRTSVTAVDGGASAAADPASAASDSVSPGAAAKPTGDIADAANQTPAHSPDAPSHMDSDCQDNEQQEAFIREPFNYEHAATSIMELFAKNVHEPTKVAGMRWLLLLHRKAPWRILTPEDMSFPVLLKMLSDSSEQVVKLDLELFAQISLYSQGSDEVGARKNAQAFEVDPSELPYLSKFLGSLLQMFATDRVLLETRAALMVRQLCVALDPELVFCLFAKLLAMPRLGVGAGGMSVGNAAVAGRSKQENVGKAAPPPAPPPPPQPVDGAGSAGAAHEGSVAQPADPAKKAKVSGATSPELAAAEEVGGVEAAMATEPASAGVLSDADADDQVDVAAQSGSDSDENIEDGDSDVDDGDSDADGFDDDVLSAQEGADDSTAAAAFSSDPVEEEEEEEELADLDFISVMVQHLSWILVTAPETESLRVLLRQYNTCLPLSMPNLPSIHSTLAGSVGAEALAGVNSSVSGAEVKEGELPAKGLAKNAARGMEDDVTAPGQNDGTEGFMGRMRRAGSGGRSRRGASLSASTVAFDQATQQQQQQQQQQKPSKLVRVSTNASATSKLRSEQASGAATATGRAAASTRTGSGGSSVRSSIGVSGSRARSNLPAPTGSSERGRRRSMRQSRQQQAARAAKAERARHVVSAALLRVKHDVEQNLRSHGLFATLFRTWSHNPAACLTLCLLSQHYETAAKLIMVFGQQTQDLTVSFLVQLDKLVQLIESPVFTYLRLQLLDPLQHPLLVRALYGLLMLLPQSSAFAILRNRLSTVAMVPFPGQFIQPYYHHGHHQQQQQQQQQCYSQTAKTDGHHQQQSQYHYHYHYHNYYQAGPRSGDSIAGKAQHASEFHLTSSSNSPSTGAGVSASTAASSTTAAAASAGASGGVHRWGGPLFSAVGISSQDLSELMRLLSVSSQRGGSSTVSGAAEAAGSAGGAAVDSELAGGLAQQLTTASGDSTSARTGSAALANPSAILQQLAELQLSQPPDTSVASLPPQGTATSLVSAPPQQQQQQQTQATAGVSLAANSGMGAASAASPPQAFGSGASGDYRHGYPQAVPAGVVHGDDAHGRLQSHLPANWDGNGWQQHPSALLGHADRANLEASSARDTARLLDEYKAARQRHAAAVIRHQSR